MGKGRSKNKAKRSTATLPKGIPHKRGGGIGGASPFEYARTTNSTTRVKHHVHNRLIPGQLRPNRAGGAGGAGAGGAGGGGGREHQSSLAKSIARRRTHLASRIERSKKSNQFVDRRIGEATRNNNYDGPSREDVMLKRIVRERVRRSKKSAKFSLDDADDGDGGDEGLTHRGKAIDSDYTGEPIDHADVLLSDDDDGDNLDRVDTMLHFGGGKFDGQNARERGAYGGGGEGGVDIGDAYRSRKEELEETIRRKKMEKAERIKRKEDQVETFETMDESFAELAHLLQFRDKEQERVKKSEARKGGTLTQDEMEMDAWDKEMKTYLFERKVKATDRTKTPEEIAAAEAERLHALESKRLARMAGDFLSEDEFSDISDDDDEGRRKKKRRRRRKDNNEKKEEGKREWGFNPEELSDSEDEKEEEDEVQFTADGLVYVDKTGKVVGKVGDESKKADSDDDESGDDEDDDESGNRDLGDSDDEASAADGDSSADDDSDDAPAIELEEGMAVRANYHASEQYGGKAHWYAGTIAAVHRDPEGNATYDVTYEDGDFEEGMVAENVRLAPKAKEERTKAKEGEEEEERAEGVAAKKKKKLKAKLRAKASIPFVFEVPTTLDALHDVIASHASTGADASLIVQRIHATNSVRLNHRNREKMQNFYDVLLRRFVAVGDAIFASGNGGPDLERYEQLNSLTKTLYAMSQESPECAGAVWSRRLGIFQKALSKRLRDVEVTPLGDACEDEFTAWPSTGMLLLMRALPHIFPSTDRRHAVITPALLLLGQILAQTPVKTRYDVVVGLFCAGLMLEYTKGAKRLPPEAMAFLAGVLRLFADDVESALADGPLPSLGNAFKCSQLMDLRHTIGKLPESDTGNARLSLEKERIQSDSITLAILNSALCLTQQAFHIIGKSEEGSEREIFGEILKSLLFITGNRRDLPLPPVAKSRLAETARLASSTCAADVPRQPLQRRKAASVKELAIKTLAPKIEDPSRYRMSKDKGKSQLRAEHDRNRREYKREHKAAMRELRLDSAFIESERRKTKNNEDSKAREKRNKNYAWLEQEQATMNQQVRLGGGLLSGGGIGAAKAKAKSGKMGVKKGGKF